MNQLNIFLFILIKLIIFLKKLKFLPKFIFQYIKIVKLLDKYLKI